MKISAPRSTPHIRLERTKSLETRLRHLSQLQVTSLTYSPQDCTGWYKLHKYMPTTSTRLVGGAALRQAHVSVEAPLSQDGALGAVLLCKDSDSADASAHTQARCADESPLSTA